MTFEEIVAGEGSPFEKSTEINAKAAEVRWTFCRDGVLSDVWH